MYKVLIADDERIAREGLKNSIHWERLGLTLCGVAKNGLEALALIQQELPDIVISDIKMPGLNGIELLEKVKPSHPNILFILLSAYGEFEFAQHAMRYGVKHYLLKPSNNDKIEQVLQNVVAELEKRGTESSLDVPPVTTTPSNLSIQPKNAKLIQDTLNYINEHLHESNLNLKNIAGNVFFINADYLGRLFKTHTGEKFSDYVGRKRIEQAKALMKANPELKIYEICMMCGLGSNTEYFSQLFKKSTGFTPNAYKRNVSIKFT